MEICAGAGGLALGLEQAGFAHQLLVDIDPDCCATLRANRPRWNVRQGDARELDGGAWHGVDLLAGGVPCPPFSIAGLRKGSDDERDLFPALIELAAQIRPKAVLVENVPGLGEARFSDYLESVCLQLRLLGYGVQYTVLRAFEHGVPQLRPRFFLVGMHARYATHFRWPIRAPYPYSVGEVCAEEMGSLGWEGVEQWLSLAGAHRAYAPTIVAGSRIHGGPDMGPSRSRERWRNLGFSSKSVADAPPRPGDPQPPRITMNMLARIQAFPPAWQFIGTKTSRWKQIGNAVPLPLAAAVGKRIALALRAPDIDYRGLADFERGFYDIRQLAA